ncbi:uncharacterized protein METZ01_LOCUS384704, partial [marine metagenome]
MTVPLAQTMEEGKAKDMAFFAERFGRPS